MKNINSSPNLVFQMLVALIGLCFSIFSYAGINQEKETGINKVAGKIYERGYRELYDGNMDTAAYFFHKVISFKPNDYTAISYHNLAEINFKYANTDSALICARKAFDIFQKTNTTGLSELMRVMIRVYETKKGSETLDTLIAQALMHLKQENNTHEIIIFYKNVAKHYIRFKDYRQASVFLQQALTLSEKTRDLPGKSDIYYEIGNFLIENSENYQAALDYHLKSLEIIQGYKETNQAVFQTRYNSIGYSYFKLGNDSLACLYLNKSLSIRGKSYYRHQHSDACAYLAEIFEKKADYNRAVDFYQQSFELSCRICPDIYFHNRLINIGRVYQNTGNFENAHDLYLKSLKLANKFDANPERSISYYYLGNLSETQSNYAKAEWNYKQSYKFAQKGNNLLYLQKSAEAIGNILTQNQAFKEACSFLELSKKLSDSIHFTQEVANLSGLSFHLQMIKLNGTIAQEKQISETRLHEQRQIIAFSAFVVLLICIILVIIYRNYLHKKRDNLELKQQKEKIEMMNSEITQISHQLHEADQFKLQFFTNISHELRTPLTLITAPLDKLLKVISNDNYREYLEIIKKNSSKLSHLINQLLNLRNIDEKTLHTEIKQADIILFIKEIILLFQPNAQNNRVHLDFQSNKNNFLTFFDPEKMETIITNLLTNALKFTPVNGFISVIVNITTPGYVEIIVKDTGTGVEKEELDKIFNRFYSGRSKTVNNNLGSSGIGLNLVKELVKVHKGNIKVESEKGKGSTFTIQIPVDEKAYKDDNNNLTSVSANFKNEHPVDIDKEFTSGTEFKNHRILIVEDNTDLLKFLEKEISGFAKVITANNGEEGLQKIEQELPDLIISDIMMPLMDGIEMCRQIKTNINTSHIPVLLLSAKASVEHQLEGINMGADDYIPKPFDLELLMAKINSVLRVRNNLRKLYRHQLSIVPEEITVTSADEHFLGQMLKIIDKNLSEPDLSANTFVSVIGMSRSVLYSKLKEITGQSVNEFVRTIKLKKASQILLQNNNTISEVAYMFGFNTPQYFTKCFKEEFGKSPKDYIAHHSNK